jgi:hypothetical protein
MCLLTGTVPGSFRTTTKELPAKSIQNFDLTEYSYVSLHIYQCYYCNVNVKLTCNNSVVDNEVVFGRNGTQMVCVYIISLLLVLNYKYKRFLATMS